MDHWNYIGVMENDGAAYIPDTNQRGISKVTI